LIGSVQLLIPNTMITLTDMLFQETKLITIKENLNN